MHDIEAEREEERLVSVGKSDDHVRSDGGRVVGIRIDKRSQLIGCELAEIKHKNEKFTDLFFGGVTWLLVRNNTHIKDEWKRLKLKYRNMTE